MLVEAKKTKDGYLIPKEALKNVDKEKLLIEIEIKDIDNMNYKELVGEAVWEHYLEKEKRSIPSKLTKKDWERFYKKYNLEDIKSIDDIIARLENR